LRRLLAASLVMLASLAPVGPVPAGAAPTPTVSFATPQDGTTVGGPLVELAVDVTGFELAPAGSLNAEGRGHVHILIDQEPPGPRSFLPTNDPAVVHLGKPPFGSRAIELKEGRHTLTAVLGDSDHLVVAHQPTKITIVVAPGARASGPVDKACADVARGAGELRLVYPVAGGAVQGTVTATCAFSTSEGSCAWTDASFRRIKGVFSQNTIQGVAAGFTTRQLVSGPRDKCGENRTSPLAPQAVQAQVTGSGVRGTLGAAAFTLVADPAARLAQPPATVAPAPSGGKKDRSSIVYLPFAAAALVIAAAVVYAVRARRRAATEG
jgi:hypothetical protein